MKLLLFLCILFFLFFLFFLMYQIYRYNKYNNPSYGEICGKTEEGVIFYSKQCDSDYKNNINYVNGYQTGESWQCVEFVRRFLIITKGITFDKVDNAYNIWDLSSFQSLDGVPIPINKIKNIKNIKNNHPQKGDILVWNKYVDDNETGHVAIVTDVDRKGNVFIAEQNWDNEFTDHNYSRLIRIEDDPTIIGWIRI